MCEQVFVHQNEDKTGNGKHNADSARDGNDDGDTQRHRPENHPTKKAISTDKTKKIIRLKSLFYPSSNISLT